MSSFDKFMKDLERKQEKRKARDERLKQSEDAHGIRERVRMYAEKWQNSVRYSWRSK